MMATKSGVGLSFLLLASSSESLVWRRDKLNSRNSPSHSPTTLRSQILLRPSIEHFTNMAHEINNDAVVTVIEQCGVGPPPGSLPSTNLPLTFFDLPWLYCPPPIQRIFFYRFPFPTHHFLQTPLPILKHSLSLTLQHFFPFASNLILPPHHHPYIRYLAGDSLSFTVAESLADFHLLVSDSQDAANWHPLVPTLPSPRTEHDGTRVIPLMAIQVTVLPNSGFTICLTFNHVVADGKSLHHFIKHWASLCKSKENILDPSLSLSLPSHERDKLKDPKGLKLIYLRDLQDSVSESMEFVRGVYASNKVRAAIVLSREKIEKLKKWMMDLTVTRVGYTPHVSTFVVTCSLIWVCMIKSEQRKVDNNCDEDEQLCYFVFSADCRDHPQLSIPSNYFGNCVAALNVAVKRGELVGEILNGMVVAANAIERKVRDFKSDALGGAETLMSDYREFGKPEKSVVVVAGSPKLAVYDTDFGWGKPMKSDSVHLDSCGSISLSDCRDREGGIEVGLALERTQMTNFINILEQQLDNIIHT